MANSVMGFHAQKTEVLGSLVKKTNTPIFLIEGTLYNAIHPVLLTSAPCLSVADAKESYLKAIKSAASLFPLGEYGADMVITENGKYYDSDELTVFRENNDVIVA